MPTRIALFFLLLITPVYAQWTGVFNPGGMLKNSVPISSGFPIVQSTSNDLTVSGPGVHTLPSGIQAGDLMLFFIKMNSTSNYSLPVGWTSSFNVVPSSSTIRMGMSYKIAVGGETTLSVSTSPSSVTSQYAIMYRITNYQATPQSATTTATSGTSIDPPNLIPAWGAADTLWIAIGTATVTNGITGVPAGYSNAISNNIKTSQRNLNAASENPGAYTGPTSVAWAAATVAIRPQ